MLMLKLQRRRNSVSQRLSFYIHIPYCVKRCGYCDFNTYTPAELQGPDLATVSQSYIDAVLKEISMARKIVGDALVPTIFFGGGTPSLMPANELTPTSVNDPTVPRIATEVACQNESPNPKINEP